MYVKKVIYVDITILLIALGLAMDSFSVAITYGLTHSPYKNKDALKVATCFGAFHVLMPAIGWLTGSHLSTFISGVDHWLAFGLLILVGGRMMYESVRKDPAKLITSLTSSVLVVLSIATSIDALGVGLSLALLKVPIALPALTTGLTTFSLSFMGVYLGTKFEQRFTKKTEFIGGLILIGIGIKILFEHLML
jgi:putative Mn2+ efflux pump MntP